MSLTLNTEDDLAILADGSGNTITSQVNGTKRALDVGVNVAGVQVDPRSIRALTSADVVTVQGGNSTAVKVDGSAVTQPVSGTVTANAGSGTFAISASALPLPSGAATSAKQPALGTAGTASSDVITVQGIASMTALKVDGSGVTQPVSGSVSVTQTTSPWVTKDQATGTTATAASTTAMQVAGRNGSGNLTTFSTDANGKVNVDLNDGTGNPISSVSGALKVDGSAVTQPVSAASLPLPSGASTAANQTTGNASLSSIDTKLDALANGVTQSLYLTNSYSPDPHSDISGTSNAMVDASGRMEVHASVTTDEGSLREDFPGAALSASIGTVSFTSGGTAITGTGFWAGLKMGDYVKKSADADTLYARVYSIDSDTSATLETAYAETTASAAAVKSNWLPVTGTGATLSVASSLFTIAAPVTSGSTSYIYRAGDYGPLVGAFAASMTARPTNQTVSVGFQQTMGATAGYCARFEFNGTTNTSVDCVTASSSAAADTQRTTISIPGLIPTSTKQKYEIDVTNNQVTFVINGVIVAIHQDHIPGPYDSMTQGVQVINTGTASATNSISIDWIQFNNIDQVELTNGCTGEPLAIQGNLPATQVDRGNPIKVGAVYSGTLPTYLASYRTDMQSDSRGRLVVTPNSQAPTYSASTLNLVAATTATDLFTITGSATKTVIIKKIEISATQTTAAVGAIVLLKRSTANTAGTSTTLTNVPMDSATAAATATVRAYTANPTTGTLVGNIKTSKIFIPQTSSTSVTPLVWRFSDGDQAPLVLRGVAEVVAVNLNSVSFAGNQFCISIEWSEE
jgi:hypothetical protein